MLRSDGTEIACRVLLEHDADVGLSIGGNLSRAWMDPVTTEES